MGDVIPFREKRNFPRVEFQCAIGVLHDGRFETFRAEEIGQDGVSFLADFDSPIGKRVVVSFHIPYVSLIITQAQVKKVEDFSGGLKKYFITFMQLSFTNERHLRKYIAEQFIQYAESEQR
ncbi:MAG: PilZ domain-containing protein [Bdellovibrionales bacterium]|nr:PilZ domain-containing protein [Bdellovibrionales bacterium]